MKTGISKTFTLILLILFFIGMVVMLYPAVSQYWNSRVQSKVVYDYQKMMEAISEEDYSDTLSRAYEYNAALAGLSYPLRDYVQLTGYRESLDPSGNGMMGYISIDKIGVSLPVYHGTDGLILNYACGHLEGSSLPVGGEGTHCVLSAHRGLPSAKLFTDLDKLQVGDTFTVTVLGQVLTYEVNQIKVVKPDDASDLLIEEGQDYVTLLTCTPYGINTHRLLVRGHRIETVEHKIVYVNSEAYLIDKLIVTPCVALPILFVLILIVLFKPARPQRRRDDMEDWM